MTQGYIELAPSPSKFSTTNPKDTDMEAGLPPKKAPPTEHCYTLLFSTIATITLSAIAAAGTTAGAEILTLTDAKTPDMAKDALASFIGTLITHTAIALFIQLCQPENNNTNEKCQTARLFTANIAASATGAAIGSGIFGDNAAHVTAAASIGSAVLGGAISLARHCC
jgi:hypothetical protein